MMHGQVIGLSHFQLFLKKFYDYVDKNVYYVANEAILIRDLGFKQDSCDLVISIFVDMSPHVWCRGKASDSVI